MTFESCLKIAVKQNPIILSNPSQIVENELPYWANSIHEFYSWSYAKRKAHEWMRALCLKRKSVKLMKEINNLTYSGNHFVFLFQLRFFKGLICDVID